MYIVNKLFYRSINDKIVLFFSDGYFLKFLIFDKIGKNLWKLMEKRNEFLIKDIISDYSKLNSITINKSKSLISNFIKYLIKEKAIVRKNEISKIYEGLKHINKNDWEGNFFELDDYYKSNNLISFAQIELTRRCNLNCFHCYLDRHYRYSKKMAKNEMDLNQLKKVFKKLASSGVYHLILSGGEPFLRKDFMEIIRCASKVGFFITLNTNGILIDDLAIQELKNNPYIRCIQVSLYGHNKIIHESITNLKGSFEKTKQNLLKLDPNNAYYNVKIANTLNIKNYKYEEDLKKIAKINGFRYETGITRPTMDGNDSAVLYKVIFSTLRKRKNVSKEAKNELKENMELKESYSKLKKLIKEKKYENLKDSILCSAGLDSIYISPDGSVKPCYAFNDSMIVGNILHDSIGSLFKKIKNKGFPVFLKDMKYCKNCKHIKACNLCSADIYNMVGDIHGCSKFIKKTAELKMKLNKKINQKNLNNQIKGG